MVMPLSKTVVLCKADGGGCARSASAQAARFAKLVGGGHARRGSEANQTLDRRSKHLCCAMCAREQAHQKENRTMGVWTVGC
jgi:hypothetical protein